MKSKSGIAARWSRWGTGWVWRSYLSLALYATIVKETGIANQ